MRSIIINIKRYVEKLKIVGDLNSDIQVYKGPLWLEFQLKIFDETLYLHGCSDSSSKSEMPPGGAGVLAA